MSGEAERVALGRDVDDLTTILVELRATVHRLLGRAHAARDAPVSRLAGEGLTRMPAGLECGLRLDIAGVGCQLVSDDTLPIFVRSIAEVADVVSSIVESTRLLEGVTAQPLVRPRRTAELEALRGAAVAGLGDEVRGHIVSLSLWLGTLTTYIIA